MDVPISVSRISFTVDDSVTSAHAPWHLWTTHDGCKLPTGYWCKKHSFLALYYKPLECQQCATNWAIPKIEVLRHLEPVTLLPSRPVCLASWNQHPKTLAWLLRSPWYKIVFWNIFPARRHSLTCPQCLARCNTGRSHSPLRPLGHIQNCLESFEWTILGVCTIHMVLWPSSLRGDRKQ